MDFDRFSKEFFLKTKNVTLKDILKNYQLPNYEDLHNMICGSALWFDFDDKSLYDRAESIDYFDYEKELWNLEKH